MGTITIRLDDRVQDKLAAVARAQGITLSELARSALATLLTNADAPPERSGQAAVPSSLTTVERAQLALLHRILGHLAEGGDEEGDRAHQVGIAEILEQGYTADYEDVFVDLEAELSRRETTFVMDVLEMFEVLETSFASLSDDDKASLGEHSDLRVRFRRFDANSRREGRLLTYAQRLIEDGRWQGLADRFDRTNDRGNSHSPVVDQYERMVTEFNPIWRVKLREGGMRNGSGYELSVSEIATVLRGSMPAH